MNNFYKILFDLRKFSRKWVSPNGKSKNAYPSPLIFLRILSLLLSRLRSILALYPEQLRSQLQASNLDTSIVTNKPSFNKHRFHDERAS